MGEWQKLFVGILVDLGLSHDIAMLVMGKTCDLRQKAYMQGYDKGWSDAVERSSKIKRLRRPKNSEKNREVIPSQSTGYQEYNNCGRTLTDRYYLSVDEIPPR
jgi:hypothetical protein